MWYEQPRLQLIQSTLEVAGFPKKAESAGEGDPERPRQQPSTYG